MYKDIMYLDKVMGLKTKMDLYKNYFCWLYPFTNENISAYFSKLDFKDKTVLTVTSSGDHVINSILMGAKEVDAFDVNPLAKHYSELKIAAIKSLTFEEFLLFFYNKNIFKTQKYYMNYDMYYDKIRNNLTSESLMFWDYVFENYTSKELYKSNLFTTDFLDLEVLLKVNPYMNIENYDKLKELLHKVKVNYHDIDIKDLNSLNKKYDVIVLSNITAFIDEVFKDNSLLELKNIIDNIRHDDSEIVVNYYYNNLLNDNTNDSSIYNLRKVKKYFEDYEMEYFKSTDEYNKTFKLFPKKDAVLYLKKRRG